MEYIIGIDLGGTQLRGTLADTNGSMLAEEWALTYVDEGPQAVIARMVTLIQVLVPQLPPGGQLLGIGIGAPGPLDPKRGLIINAPNMPGWVQIPLRDAVAQATGLPVVLGNDANAAALGEWRFGGGIGRKHLVYITVSTGIGSGVIVDGHLVEGRYGCGGELGLMVFDPVSRASWEDLASGTGLARAAARAMLEHPESLLHTISQGGSVRAQHVAQAAAQGDALAQSLMEREAVLLGLGFASIMHIFSPELILVGGSVVTENPQLLDRATRVMRERVMDDIYREVPVHSATLGARAGLLGAVALLLYDRELRG